MALDIAELVNMNDLKWRHPHQIYSIVGTVHLMEDVIIRGIVKRVAHVLTQDGSTVRILMHTGYHVRIFKDYDKPIQSYAAFSYDHNQWFVLQMAYRI